jgi:hypothetical protein
MALGKTPLTTLPVAMADTTLIAPALANSIRLDPSLTELTVESTPESKVEVYTP